MQMCVLFIVDVNIVYYKFDFLKKSDRWSFMLGSQIYSFIRS